MLQIRIVQFQFSLNTNKLIGFKHRCFSFEINFSNRLGAGTTTKETLAVGKLG